MSTALLQNLPQYLTDPPTFVDRLHASSMPPVILQNTPPIEQYASNAWAFLHTPMGFGASASVGVAGILFIAGYYWRRRQAMAGVADMRHWKRQQIVKKFLSDAFTDAVEDIRYKDKITRAEKFQLYREFAKALDCADLVVERSSIRKKAEIRHRLNNGVYKHKPDIPGKPEPAKRKASQITIRGNLTKMLAMKTAM
ncbi:MAG: hypothetical protein ACREHG_05105 [Candidatus Saccharimonadales bacterium]